MRVAAASAAAAAAAGGGQPDAAGAGAAAGEGTRHAVLHDFCMCIPYGVLLAAGGLLALVFGGGPPALAMTAAGATQVRGRRVDGRARGSRADVCAVAIPPLAATQVWLSTRSLKAWKAGRSGQRYTVAAAGARGPLRPRP